MRGRLAHFAAGVLVGAILVALMQTVASTAAQAHHLPLAQSSAASAFPVAYRWTPQGSWPRCSATLHIGGLSPRPRRPDGTVREADGEWDAERCQIRIHPRWQQWTPAYLCTLVTHERGHGARLGHSGDPNSVMYADEARWIGSQRTAENCRWMEDKAARAERSRDRWAERVESVGEKRADVRDDLREAPRRSKRRLWARVRRLTRKLARTRRVARRAEAEVRWWR